MADIIGFDLTALQGWYQAKNAVRLASASPRPSGASTGNAQQSSSASGVLPPWDVRGEVADAESLSRKALATGIFFEKNLGSFADLDVSADYKNLFAMYQGLRRMHALALEAADKTTTDTRRNFLDNRFGQGVSQFDDFFNDLDLEGVTLLKGEQLSKVESGVAINRGTSEYTTGIIHTGDFDAEVASLTGDVQFTISVKKSGTTQDININLADMGATVRNLDNVAAHINTQLEAAGILTRFERVKIGEKDDSGVIPGNDFGFHIQGVLTEQVSFSAASASPAVYLAGNSGIAEDSAGQLVRLTDLGSGSPTVDYTRRIEATPDTTETTNDKGETKTTTETNPLTVRATAVSGDGGVYVVGETSAGVEGQTIKGETDLVLQKRDSTGRVVWTRTLGAAGEAEGASIAVDASGNVVVSGTVKGTLGTSTNVGGEDSFVAKYNTAGVEQWLQRFGGTADDRTTSVTLGSDGTVYVAGEAKSGFGDTAHAGGTWDGYVRAISADGAHEWTRRIGDAGEERARAVAVADDGGLLVASEEDGRAILRKYSSADGTGAALWETDLGDLDGGRIGGLAVEGTDIYLTGAAGSAFAPSAPLSANAGGRDAMVVKLTDGASASVAWTTFVGSDADDSAAAIQVSGGKVYVSGKTTGSLPGSTINGSRNAFVAEIDGATGGLGWTQQISGRGGISEGTGIAVDAEGDSVLSALGLPRGSLTYSDTRVVTDRTSVRDGDHFFIAVDGGRRKKITIDADDTIRSLTFKINAALVLDGTADVRRSTAGDQLRITPKENVTIELFSGTEGRDALKGLGIQPGAVHKKPSLLNEDATSDAPPLFALGLPATMKLDTRDKAATAVKALEDAMSVIQRAYRDLMTPQSVKDLLSGNKKGKSGGTVPAYLQAQYANYAAGLSRLTGGA